MQYIRTLAIILLLTSGPLRAADAVQVFACEPEWAALAQEIGGKAVKVFAATHARQDPHYIRARPSLIAAMRRADLLICSGGGLEVGWLPVLLQKAGNPAVAVGAPGHLLAAAVVELRDVPEHLDRSQGDVHPEGNPHLHLDPHNIDRVAGVLAERLQGIDPDRARHYQSRLEDFRQRWDAAIDGWEKRGIRLQGLPVIVHHQAWVYLIDWLGLHEVAALEPRPGIPPTASHLERLLQRVREEGAAAILRTPYTSPEAADWLSARTGLPVRVLPYTVGGTDGVNDLFALFEQTLVQLESVRVTGKP
ncbi:MAG TPA: zinc ABC transporter substrate-binding protein [Thiohalobacter sp.]|nr:zinc ABC transporter substrate-binding protein [Thiohalobacter sp.]